MVRVDETEAIITRALELGVNFIDTANTYGSARARSSSEPR